MSSEDGGFHWDELAAGVTVGRFDVLHELHIPHAVTTRQGLDAALPLSDPAKAAQIFAGWLTLGGAAWMKQVHQANVMCISEPGFAGEADGMLTDQAEIGLVGRSADCPLVFLADRSSGVVGVFHAGWRGTIAGIATESVRQAVGRFGCNPQEIVACICPSAGPCCYEVGQEVQQAALAAFGTRAKKFVPMRDGKMYFDMWGAIRDQLLRVGLAGANVFSADLCTICHNNIFPSFRQEGDSAGRFQAIIAKGPTGG